ncbi:MAG: ABC-2 family transporter protein [Armatimonadetes bacterium]|nr:ABC-2 family transporter protein [Armatimonadota bacterium]
MVSSTLTRTWRQCSGLFKVCIQDGLAYKAAGVIWVLTDVANAITMPVVWLAASKGGAIQGYTSGQFVAYYLCTLMISSFIVCHFMWDISMEIREGVFSSHIIRPVPYMLYIVVRNFAWRLVRSGIFFPWFLVFLVSYTGATGPVQLHLGWEFWTSVLLGHFVSVTLVTAMAMIALFTEEAQTIFELYYFPMLFLSGQLFPLALLPQWASKAAKFLPFYYTTGAPTEILVGKADAAQIPWILTMQVAWIGLSLVLFKALWTRGMRRYAGVGM